MFDPGYYVDADLAQAGFRSVGKNVSIAKTCTIVGLPNISIGDNVRIDGYCLLIATGEGSLTLGSYIHVGAYCLLSAGDGITLGDFSNLSQGVRIYSRSDDYSGQYLTNPTVPAEFTNVTRGSVRLQKHVIIGSGSVILPQVEIGEGSAVGALSLVKRSLDPWGIYAGAPARRIKARSKKLLSLEEALLRQAE